MTWANQIRILKQEFIQFGSIVGKGVIAAFKPFIKGMNNVMLKVIGFTENVLNALGQIFGWKYEISAGSLDDDLGDSADAMGNLSDGAGNTASGIKDATDAAKKFKSVVLGIDELNLNEPDTDSGSGSGGSGGSGGGSVSGSGAGSGGNTGLSIEKKELKPYESDIKTLYQLGNYISNALSDTLEGIDWNAIYKKAENFGSGLADFLNGLITPRLFYDVGQSIANSLNTALHAVNAFAVSFNWSGLGESLMSSIRGFFENWDAKLTGKTFSNLAIGILKGAIAACKDMKDNHFGKTVAQKLVDFVNGVNWKSLTWNLGGFFVALVESLTATEMEFRFTLIDAVIGGLADSFKDADKWLQDSLGDMSTQLDQFKGDCVKVWENISSGIHEKYLDISSGASEAWDNIKTTFASAPLYFGEKWEGIKNYFSRVPSWFGEVFSDAYDETKNAWAFVGTWASEKWEQIKAPFKNIKKYFSDGFTGAYNSVKKIWNGIGKYFKGIANDIITPIGSAVNGIISGVNWVLSKVGSKTRLDKWSVPRFASGADGLPQDTVGMVNDQPGNTYKEMIVPKNGEPFIPKGRNVVLPMEKGTKIMPADQTKALMQSVGVPRFAGGIGQFFNNAWDSAKDIAGGIADYISHPDKLLQIALNKFVDISNFVHPISDIAGGVVKTTFNSIKDYIKGKLDAFVPKVTYSPSGGVEQWRAVATQALRITNQLSDANINALLNQMKHESGGNPNAINNWDINAKNGTPSKGLMQVIDPTFRAYALAPYNTNIYDPLSNMIAAIRYTVSRYGSLYNGWTKRGYIGYKTGIGAISLSDLPKYSVGGFPEDGLFMANRKELVGQFNGRNAVVNNYQIESGIEKAVYNGYMRAHAQDTREVSVLEEILTAVREGKTISIDGREIVRVYDSRKARNGYAFT